MNMEEMLAQAKQAAETIQKQMGEAQAKLDDIEVEGSAGGGLVKVRATARGRILGVAIDDSLMKPEEKQMVEDLVTAAFNDARRSRFRRGNEQNPAGRGLAAGFQTAGNVSAEFGLPRARRKPGDPSCGIPWGACRAAKAELFCARSITHDGDDPCDGPGGRARCRTAATPSPYRGSREGRTVRNWYENPIHRATHDAGLPDGR
jgi:DNA-binding YbaB/EbfC family protein